MSIKSTLFSLIDNVGLAETFNIKPHDPAKVRAPLLKGIESARKQFTATPRMSKAPNRWWTVKNGVVALTVKVQGDTFDINGVATNHMPEERFVEFLGKFEEAVKAGEFDDELKHKGNGDAKVRIAPSRQPSGGSGGTRGARSPISNLRSSVGRSLSNGRPLDEIEAALKADGKFSAQDIDAVIAEKRAAS
jgi:hypothetical protein